MSSVTAQISVSLDGYAAGPNQSVAKLEPIQVVASPAVTHVKYRVVR